VQILITGSNGFIGKNLYQLLTKENYEIILVDITKGENVICDLTDPIQVGKLFEKYSPEIIIHLAAISSTSESVKDAIQTQKVNFLSTVNLFEIASRKNFNLNYFVFASTTEVYGGLKTSSYNEKYPPTPLTPYSASKVAAESFIQMKSHNSEIKSCILRFCNTYGRTNDNSFLIEYLLNCFNNNIPPIIKTPESIREFMYLPDHLNIYKIILENRPSGIINASSGDKWRIMDLAIKIQELMGTNLEIIAKSESKTSIISDTSKIRNLGFEPQYDFFKGIKDFIK
jgi:UDP-glucose 4-epimerase